MIKNRANRQLRTFRTLVAVAVVSVVGLLLAFALQPEVAYVFLMALVRTSWVLPIWVVAHFWRHPPRSAPALRVYGVWVMGGLLLLYLVSATAGSGDFFFLRWLPNADLPLGRSGLERTLLWGGLLLVLYRFSPRLLSPLLLVALVVLQVSAFIGLMEASGGAPLYRVDHPSFLYRLWSWGQSAPRFMTYDPHWNGGKVMPYLVASGVLGPGILLWPVWRFLDITRSYTPAFGFLFCFLVPALAALSARLVTRDRVAWVIAAMLSSGTSQFTFIHLVHYGTFGSLLAAAFLMPFAAFLYRVMIQRREHVLNWLGLGGALAMVLCWPPAAIMAIPFVFALLVCRKWLTLAFMTRGLVVVLVMFVLFSLPALSLLTHSNIEGITRSVSDVPVGQLIHMGFNQLAELLRRTHPVLLFAGLLGVIGLPLRRYRSFFLPILVVSLMIAAFGKSWKPTLQLDRVWVNALYIAILPASLVIGMLWRRKTVCGASHLAALFTGVVLMGGYTGVKYMNNEGRAKYNTMTSEMQEVVAWLRANVPEDGRVLFAGAAVHGYSGGKVASLPIYTGREMMACDYYGFSTKLVEYNYPPAEFRKHGPEKMAQFMEFYNVTHIITYHRYWQDYLRTYHDRYEEVWTSTVSDKVIFRLARESSLIQQGEGRVEAGINRIDVDPADATESLVIRYNWVDGLVCQPAGAVIEPYETGTRVRLIRVIPNGSESVRIRYGRWY